MKYINKNLRISVLLWKTKNAGNKNINNLKSTLEKKLKYSSVLGSKAIGEPPLVYGEAVYFAIRNALKSVIADDDMKDFKLAMPATAEAIVLSLFKKQKE